MSITVKKKKETTEEELNTQFQERLFYFGCHIFIVKWQFDIYRELRRNLECNECILHVIFSDNYSTKYSEEIQVMHFGSSPQQATLHIGVLQTEAEWAQLTFCQISPSSRHVTVVIWAHVNPILKVLRKRHPQVSLFNFFCDGPAKHYRRKGNFFCLSPSMVSKKSHGITLRLTMRSGHLAWLGPSRYEQTSLWPIQETSLMPRAYMKNLKAWTHLLSYT